MAFDDIIGRCFIRHRTLRFRKCFGFRVTSNVLVNASLHRRDNISQTQVIKTGIIVQLLDSEHQMYTRKIKQL